jgi:hypothetical protein
MERLTEKNKDGEYYYKACFDEDCANPDPRCPCSECKAEYKFCERLGQYEDTGLAPEQIREMDRMYRDKCEELEGKWIPVSKRLPSEDEFIKSYIRSVYAAEFIVMIQGANQPTCLYFRDGNWFDEQRNYYKVVAWMPMPDPYTGRG